MGEAVMANVFTGKIAIPSAQIDQYLQALEAAEAARLPFRQSLEQLNQEFAEFLATKYVPKTVRKHTNIVDLFIHFICGYTDVGNLEELTKGMVNSHFRSWYKRKVLDSATESELRVALRKFFQFLDTEKGQTYHKILDALK
jgi:site-specific recombinase XerD